MNKIKAFPKTKFLLKKILYFLVQNCVELERVNIFTGCSFCGEFPTLNITNYTIGCRLLKSFSVLLKTTFLDTGWSAKVEFGKSSNPAQQNHEYHRPLHSRRNNMNPLHFININK